MQKLLQKLRSRSLRERQRIVYGSAFVVTLLICGIWLSLLEFDKRNQVDSESTSDQFAPLKSLSNGMYSMWANAKYSVSKKPEISDTSADSSVSEKSIAPSEVEIKQNSGGQIILEPQPIELDSSTPITN